MSSSRCLREYGSGSGHSHSHSHSRRSLSPPSSSSPATASFIASASLPCDGDAAAVSAATVAASRAASVDAVHVLAVDDSFVDRKVIEKLLKHSAYKVTTVDSGRRALEILGLAGEDQLHDDEINLIITDYCMPGMSGYDLLKAIKESSALKEIPVVVMSSENVPHRINRCLAEGAEEFLLKPVKLADVKRLRGHVRHQQQLRHASNQASGDDEEATECPDDGSNKRGPRISTRSFFS